MTFYDEIGNRLTDKYGNSVYDSTGQRMIEDWQYAYHFDLNGNLVSKLSKDIAKDSFNYSYSSKNQLIEVVQIGSAPSLQPNGYLFGQVKKRTVYFYDVLGRRMQKSVEDYTSRDENSNLVINSSVQRVFSRKYMYDGDNILAEYDGSNAVLARYTHSPLKPDDVLSAEITPSGVTAGLAQSAGKVYYLKDALGTVTDVVDASGSVVQRYEYESFGKITSIRNGTGIDISNNPAVNTSFTFTGREWDEDAGLYYYRARYYDASTGRFLQQDPDPGKVQNPMTVINKYAYAGNSPTKYVDPFGRFFLIDDIALIAVFAVVGAIDQMRQGHWGIEQILGGALKGAVAGLILTYFSAGMVDSTSLFGFQMTTQQAFVTILTATSAIKAGATTGSFANNFFDNIIHDAPLSWLGMVVVDILPNMVSSAINYDIPNFSEAIYVGGVIHQLNDFKKTGCNKTKAGWLGSDLCK